MKSFQPSGYWSPHGKEKEGKGKKMDTTLCSRALLLPQVLYACITYTCLHLSMDEYKCII